MTVMVNLPHMDVTAASGVKEISSRKIQLYTSFGFFRKDHRFPSIFSIYGTVLRYVLLKPSIKDSEQGANTLVQNGIFIPPQPR